MSVQKNILAQMTKVGHSTRSLAKAIGVDPHTMAEMLKSETEIEYHHLKRIAATLRTTPEDLEQENDCDERSLMAIVSDNIMTYRQKHGITQAQFAKRCNVSQSAICRIEKLARSDGKRLESITLSSLILLAKGMNITVPRLLTQNAEPIETPPVVIEPTDPVEPQSDLYTTIYTAVKAALKEVL